MITNERQYKITKTQLQKLKIAILSFDIHEATKLTGSKVLAKAEFEALQSEVSVLSAQLLEYESLKSGAVTIIRAQSLDELPRLLIQARISQGLTQRELAEKLNTKEQQIQRYESEEYASASLRRIMEISKILELEISEVAQLRKKKKVKESIQPTEIDWSRFPIKEMYRRGWFEGFTGSLKAAIAEKEVIVEAFVTNFIRKPSMTLYRKKVRSGSIIDNYSLLAWECRVLSIARRDVDTSTFNRKSITDEWINELVKKSQYPDGPIRAKDFLKSVGISLIIEPLLSGTHIDGAAFYNDGKPVIGLTLRYDRLDNFWFVLLHELFHISKHLRKGETENIFDDMDSEPDMIETEADELASRALIPYDVWETALARYVRNEESVMSLSEELNISPAIIAGRIRNESDNYFILNNIIGQGDVRKQFHTVDFGV
jgi:HTH-type transcriptional regulator/antitoxin HigA